ncbi:hypothetical protein F4778DRAFT_245748 [Xylariomycetidae sp. FL2044]|nr:hypothetical protein F4778DRAFT_245748 [Xylariomycetidae sp. FL2044]
MASRSLALLAVAMQFAASIADDTPPFKPVISPAFDFYGTLEDGLRANLAPTQSTWDQWGEGWIPDDCKWYAEYYGYAANEFEVFNVKYTDCDEAWIMCRHKQATVSQTGMIDLFGRLPLGMREYVKHVVMAPETKANTVASSYRGTIAFDQDYFSIYNLVHETGHCMDGTAALDVFPDGISSSSIWQDNYNQDSAVVRDYARSSWVENFAETGTVAVYDKVVPGGIGPIQPNWEQIYHQYATYNGYLSDIITPGAKDKCTQRRENSETVAMGASSRIMRSSPPDTSFKSDVKVMPAGANDEFFFEHSRDH